MPGEASYYTHLMACNFKQFATNAWSSGWKPDS